MAFTIIDQLSSFFKISSGPSRDPVLDSRAKAKTPSLLHIKLLWNKSPAVMMKIPKGRCVGKIYVFAWDCWVTVPTLDESCWFQVR